MPETRNNSTSSPLLIALSWLLVVLPAIWGLTYTAQNAAKLFTGAPAAPASAPATTAPVAPGATPAPSH